MIKIRNTEQMYLPGCEPWRQIYSPRKLKILENSWADVFRIHILPLLPAKQIFDLYSFYQGRPTKELYTVIGTVVLQQFFDLTDSKTVNELAFNEQWHFALECFNNDDQVISEKTLWTMRDQIIKLGLFNSIFTLTTDRLLTYYDVDVSKQRLDSVHVHSNMARLGRIRILSRALIRFLKNLKRQDIKLFNAEISSKIIKKYLKKSKDSYFGQIKPSESEHTLQTLAEDLYSLISTFSTDGSVSQMSSFRLLIRIFGEHCDVGTGLIKVKTSKDVSSDSVQNPSDPDAGFDGYKGQGFQTQLLETYSIEDDRENSDDNKENKATLNLITYVETESADKHDSHALEPALKDMEERGHKVEKVLADTSYGSNKNIKNAANNGVEVIAPISGKASQIGFETFEIDPVTLEIRSCLSDKIPDEIKHNKSGSTTVIWYESTCENCPFAETCPTQECKKGRKFYYTEDSATSFLRRQYEESIEFKDEYRYRSGIEATNSRFIHMTGARRSRYRGLEKMRFGQKLKALAINVFRTTKYIQKVHKNIYIFDFKSNFSTINEFTTQFAA